LENTHPRFSSWRDKGIWEDLLEEVVDDQDYEWLMIDVSHARVHAHVAGTIGFNQKVSAQKGAQHMVSVVTHHSCQWFNTMLGYLDLSLMITLSSLVEHLALSL
jgi:2-keto-3-deoxy-L-rhamnonate aldolase RhmA